MANQNNNNSSNNANNNSNTNQNNNNNNSNNHQQQHTLNLHHAGLTNPSQLIISSSQLLSTMPSLAVAAAAAGITTTLLPLGGGVGQDLNTVSVSNGTSNAAGVASAASSSSSSASASSVGAAGNSSNSNTALLDLITCKLVAPFHVVNDPRMLDCGSSACFSCIMSSKDSERNLKCPYCNKIHTIPMDTSKIVAHKSLQNFLKINFRQINQGFSKQLEDSMFALERKNFSYFIF
jgi:hypothetical protein